MAGQRGLHGDLRGFGVAHFADHDDIRVLAENGAQRVGEAHADLGMDLDLVDAAELVFDRVLDGDDLERFGIELGQRGVERGGLARAGGAGDEQDAVRTVDQAAEALQGVGRKTHVFEFEPDAGAVEHAHDDAFAVDGGQGGHAQVDFVALDAGLDATVLRQAALGDVEVGKQLDARGDGSGKRGFGHFGTMQYAIDAVADVDAVFVGFDVDVGRAQVDDAGNDLVDQPDDGRLGGEVLQVFDEFAVAAEGAVEQAILVFGLLLLHVQALERGAKLGFERQPGFDAQAGGERQRLEQKGVLRFGQRSGERAVGDGQRQHAVGDEVVRRQAGYFDCLLRKGGGRYEDEAELLDQRLGDVVFGNEAEADQHMAEQSAHFALGGEGLFEIAGAQPVAPQQQFAEPCASIALSDGRGLNGKGGLGHGVGRETGQRG